MSGVGNVDLEPETQPLHENQAELPKMEEIPEPEIKDSTNHTSQSLIHDTDETGEEDIVSPYNIDTTFKSTYENPYKDTTESVPNLIRRVPSSDLVPSPFRSFNQILILSFASAVFFIFTGFFAVKFARRAKTHQGKGLYGLAQRDSKKAVIFSYLSLGLGLLLIIIIIVAVEGS